MRFVAGWGAAAKSHREDAAGQGRRSGRDTAGRGSVARGCAVAEMLMPGRSIGKREKSMREGKAASEKNMLLSFQINNI